MEIVSWMPGESATSGTRSVSASSPEWPESCTTSRPRFVSVHQCVIQDDLQPRNVLVQRERPIGLIDGEQVRPGRRIEDVANLCWSFVEPTPRSNRVDIAYRWRLVLDAYDLVERDALLPAVLTRMSSCVEDIERGASRGSARHLVLARRRDHLAIRAVHDWVCANRRFLDRAVRT